MSDVAQFISSGVLELYVLGQANPEEVLEVEQMAAKYTEVRNEIDAISLSLERYAEANAIEPPVLVRPFIMATIDYMERLKKGEAPASVPVINSNSKIADYEEWLNREDLQLNLPLKDVHATIIGYTPEVTTAIVWLKDGAPPETHTNELETFLVVEGSCEIMIGDKVHELYAGDVLAIPLYLSHQVKVTSAIPCKIILERRAA